ncbi:MAG: NAD(+) diphosphatase [Gammaproteobacteria bacterium]|nr:NAD(+) diphosphatase [Gammaproteobacteria bacterium]
MARRITFSGPYLDRAAHLRQDPAGFDAAIAEAGSCATLVCETRSLVRDVDTDAPRAALVELARLPAAARRADALTLLGRFADRPCFALEIAPTDTLPTIPGARFEDLRTIAGRLPAADAGLLGYARAMVGWRRRHRFCGVCGSPTRPVRGGHVLACTGAACGAEQFPRIDPAIIVLVDDGERALLGRQASWPAERYSTIAGFVEPGEALEDAVAREVREETGVEIERAEYFASQPWPFPASLMLGFTARAATREIRRTDQELEDARWFSRDEIASGRVRLPPRQSISFSLIEQWFDAADGRSLRVTPGARF